ncbi:MAG: Holliday junction branch migration protein RuvA [Gammaproteobacteria bacterium]
MIGWIRGIILEKQPPHLLLDVNGIGYELEAPMTTFYSLPEIGEEIHIYTHLVIRDDAHLLFGFASESERRMFRALIKVNGVGARMALTILSGIESDAFARYIQQGDSDRLVKLPGIGRKTAERLIIEMRDRLKDWSMAANPGSETGHKPGAIEKDPQNEAIGALIALGYKPQEASRYVHAVVTDDMNSEQIIREALKASVNS